MTILGVSAAPASTISPVSPTCGCRRWRRPSARPATPITWASSPTPKLVFLPRHGTGHRIAPSEINARANIHGMKQLGVTHLISVSAVGSMKEKIVPGQLVLVDQFIDRTIARPKTFFEGGIVAHVAFSDPVCAHFKKHLEAACFAAGVTAPRGRHLPLHRGAAVLDPGREPALPPVGHRRDRNDRDAGGQARARGGDVLRHHRAGDRLRLLARHARSGDGGGRDGDDEEERGERARGAAGGGADRRAAGGAVVRLRARPRPRGDDRARGDPAAARARVALLLGERCQA